MSIIFIDALLLNHFRQPLTKIIIVAIISFITMIVFRRYSALTYGTTMSRNRCLSLKLKDTWDFDCYTYPS